jgi:lysophospholipase L1-like esterase
MKIFNNNFKVRYKHVLCLFLLVFVLQIKANAQNVALPANIHRILFLGNSITYAGTYVTDIEAYFIANYPELKFEFINEGLPSETVSGLTEEGHAGGQFPRPDLHERLDRVLALTKPDLIIACYGINDGIYKPFDEGRFQKFKDGISWLHDKATSAGIRIIHVTPEVYDERLGGSVGYAAVMDTYATWLLEQHDKAKWEVVDTHFPMKKYVEAHSKIDKEFGLYVFALSTDGVHPNDAAHWLIARPILLYLGQKSAIDAPDIHAAMALRPKGEQVLKLVAKKQMMMKDAWLTAAGHKRPGMNTGLPLAEAQAKAIEIDKQIHDLLFY